MMNHQRTPHIPQVIPPPRWKVNASDSGWKSHWQHDWVPKPKPVPIYPCGTPIRKRTATDSSPSPVAPAPKPKPRPKPSTAPELLLWEYVKVEPEDEEMTLKKDWVKVEPEDKERTLKKDWVKDEPEDKEWTLKKDWVKDEPEDKEWTLKKDWVKDEPEDKEWTLKKDWVKDEPEDKEWTFKKDWVKDEPEDKEWTLKKDWGKCRRRRGRGKKNKVESSEQSFHTRVAVQDLRYSQVSCKETFQCGRSIEQLVHDLLHRKVSLRASFLTLTVFQTIDEETNESILRCIDNRRLWALKEYAKRSGKDPLMVNVSLFSHSTLKQVQRFIHNSDPTDGKDVLLRKNKQKKWCYRR